MEEHSYAPSGAEIWQNPKKAHPFAAEIAWRQQPESPPAPENPAATSTSVSPEANQDDPKLQLDQAKSQVNNLAREFNRIFDQRLAKLTNRTPEKQQELATVLLTTMEEVETSLYQVPQFSETDQADQLATMKSQLREEITKNNLQQTINEVSNISELVKWIQDNPLSKGGQTLDSWQMQQIVMHAADLAQAKNDTWRDVLRRLPSNTVRQKAEELITGYRFR